MRDRFLALWFCRLAVDRVIRHSPGLKDLAFVLAQPKKGRMVVTGAGPRAREQGVRPGMVVADARAVLPSLEVIPDQPEETEKVLTQLAIWCIRYTPVVAVDPPDGLLMDISGCAHLWGGEIAYLNDMMDRLGKGYAVRIAIADTVGAAWAVARYGQGPVVSEGSQAKALSSLPPAALRLEPEIIHRMERLGFRQIGQFINMPRPALRRRFGQSLLSRLDGALGHTREYLTPVRPVVPYQERLPCLEPIRTATGIGIALRGLLEVLCERLTREGKGLRKCTFKVYRIDGKTQDIEIGTGTPSRHVNHLFRLFELRISWLRPGLGFELFILEAPIVEDLSAAQETLWNSMGNHDDLAVTELLDRIGGKVGTHTIHRYLPQQHHWPERSVKAAGNLKEQPDTVWPSDRPRPINLLSPPQPIEVLVPLPDYPPVRFHHQGLSYNIKRADGPERIEREWWLEDGEQRDYYCVEDDNGARYWLFRLGQYHVGSPKWFLHGYFA